MAIIRGRLVTQIATDHARRQSCPACGGESAADNESGSAGESSGSGYRPSAAALGASSRQSARKPISAERRQAMHPRSVHRRQPLHKPPQGASVTSRAAEATSEPVASGGIVNATGETIVAPTSFRPWELEPRQQQRPPADPALEVPPPSATVPI